MPIEEVAGTVKELIRELHRLEENLGAADLELTPDDLLAVDDAASKIRVEGERYPEELEKRTGL